MIINTKLIRISLFGVNCYHRAYVVNRFFQVVVLRVLSQLCVGLNKEALECFFDPTAHLVVPVENTALTKQNS